MKGVRRELARRAGFDDIPELGVAPTGAQVLPSVDELVTGVYAELAGSPCRITASSPETLNQTRPNFTRGFWRCPPDPTA